MDTKYRSRKWQATKAALALEFSATMLAMYKFISTDDAAMVTATTIFILACFGSIATTLGFYFTANIFKAKQEEHNE